MFQRLSEREKYLENFYLESIELHNWIDNSKPEWRSFDENFYEELVNVDPESADFYIKQVVRIIKE